MQFADALQWSIETEVEHSDIREREHEYLAVMRYECMTDLRGYVPLRGEQTGPPSPSARRSATGAGRARVRHPQLFEVAPTGAQGDPRLADDVSQELRESGRVLLLGDPGSGKTTTLLHAAQMACREAQANVMAPIPVIVPLNLYEGDVPLRQYVRAQMGHLEDQYDRLLADERVLFLFDALNEAPPAVRTELRDLLFEFRTFVVELQVARLRAGPGGPPAGDNHQDSAARPPEDSPGAPTLAAPRGHELWEMLGGSDAGTAAVLATTTAQRVQPVLGCGLHSHLH